MLTAEWHLIDESYGWPASGFSVARMTQTAQTGDEPCLFGRTPSDRREPLIRALAVHE